jgi:hypothetical protein
MTNAIGHPISGSVTLRGVTIDINSDIGTGFVLDAVRHIEDLMSAEQLRAKYQLDEEVWRSLATNEPLQYAIERAKERRIRSGDAAREKAQHLFTAAPGILSNIMKNDNAPARNRVDAIRELRQCAGVGETTTPGTSDRVSIVINLGADERLIIDQPKKPSSPWPDVKTEDDHERSV